MQSIEPTKRQKFAFGATFVLAILGGTSIGVFILAFVITAPRGFIK